MAALPPLDKLDPAEAWTPWTPSAEEPWNRKWAAHLYRRAAFGRQLPRNSWLPPRNAALPRTRSTCCSTAGPAPNDLVCPRSHDVGSGVRRLTRDADGTQLRGWWLYCMLQGGHPLREKLTLFWHNHFATSIAKVRDPNLMFRQNRLFRDNALGKFEPACCWPSAGMGRCFSGSTPTAT